VSWVCRARSGPHSDGDDQLGDAAGPARVRVRHTGAVIGPEAAPGSAATQPIIPMILGSDSMPRTWAYRATGPAAPAQGIDRARLWLFLPGCTRPPRWTRAHHVIHMGDGGETSLENTAAFVRPSPSDDSSWDCRCGWSTGCRIHPTVDMTRTKTDAQQRTASVNDVQFDSGRAFA